MKPDVIGPAPDAGRSAALWLLRIAVVATCAGMTVATFRGDGTSINSFLFLELGMSHGAAAQLERAVMTAIVLLSVVALIRPWWPMLLPVAAYIFAEALAGWHQRGFPFSEWAVTALAPRYLTPLALILLFRAALPRGRAGGWQQVTGEWGLRIGMAVVFVVHGLEALRLHPWFIDLIISSGINLVGVRVSQSTASTMLQVIGVVDLLVALAFLLRAPAASVLAWAAFWGAVTAMSRVTANTWSAYPEVLMRATHVLVPVALWLLLRERRLSASRKIPATTSSEGNEAPESHRRGGDQRRPTRDSLPESCS